MQGNPQDSHIAVVFKMTRSMFDHNWKWYQIWLILVYNTWNTSIYLVQGDLNHLSCLHWWVLSFLVIIRNTLNWIDMVILIKYSKLKKCLPILMNLVIIDEFWSHLLGGICRCLVLNSGYVWHCIMVIIIMSYVLWVF